MRHEGCNGLHPMAELAAWAYEAVERDDADAGSVHRPSPGKVTLTQRLSRRGLRRDDIAAMIAAIARGAPLPTATAAALAAAGVEVPPAPVKTAPSTVAELEDELGSGSALEPAVADRMRRLLGDGVSGARVHTGPAAAARARAVGAAAFTIGPHVVLGGGVDPRSPAGDALFAHELAHVAQQAEAARAPHARDRPVGEEAPADERAADRAVANGEAPASAGPDLRLQRAPDEVVVPKVRDNEPPWPGGPMLLRKQDGYNPPLVDYLGWLRTFEQIYGVGPATVQRLRRMYYSAPTGGAGAKFDQLMNTGEDWPTAPPLPQEALDHLYAANGVTTPQGEVVDLSHVFVLFDLAINGTSVAGTVANQITPLAGLFTWTGDLASWFVEWLTGHTDGVEGGGEGGAEGGGEGVGEGGAEGGPEGGVEGGGEGGGGGRAEGGGHPGGVERDVERGKPIHGHVDRDAQSWPAQIADLEDLKDTKCSQDDLLGNIDAHAMGSQAPLVAGGQSMAQMLDGYYGAGAAGGVDRRFHRFVVSGQPAIPYVMTSASPLTVTLAPAATETIYGHLYRAVQALRQTPVFPLDGHVDVLRYIASRFANFLTAGLASGNATW